jgi:5'-nucleotidase
MYKSKRSLSFSIIHFLTPSLLHFLLLLPLFLSAQSTPIVILHTNDTHSHLESYYEPELKDTVGGVVRRNTLIQATRSQYPNTIIVDAGDFSQGTPYFNLYKGFPEIELMNKMGYDVVSLGNHEFDNGSKVLAKRLKKANFKIVNSNYNFKNRKLSKLVKSYATITIAGTKIGFFGLLCNMKRLIMPNYFQEVVFLDPVAAAKNMVDILKNLEQCDMIICLSHLGLKVEFDGDITDRDIAENVPGIDFIIGGHSHNLFEEPEIVNGTKILQALKNGIYAGKLIID